MRAKRSLGQNFLKNAGIAEKMASLAEIAQGDTVVEIGPGRGMLTRVLLKHTNNIVAIEKDDALFHSLQGNDIFRSVKFIHQDILEGDLDGLIPDGSKIVSNLPYNIATQLIIRLAGHARRISLAVFMLQKEVAERICAGIGTRPYSLLSVIVQAGFTARPGFIVGPNNFSPRPKVDSQVIILIPKSPPMPITDRDMFRRVVSAAFSQRRKTLRNTLSLLPSIDDKTLIKLCSQAGFHPGQRPQEISPEQYHIFSRGYEDLLKVESPHQTAS